MNFDVIFMKFICMIWLYDGGGLCDTMMAAMVMAETTVIQYGGSGGAIVYN